MTSPHLTCNDIQRVWVCVGDISSDKYLVFHVQYKPTHSKLSSPGTNTLRPLRASSALTYGHTHTHTHTHTHHLSSSPQLFSHIYPLIFLLIHNLLRDSPDSTAELWHNPVGPMSVTAARPNIQKTFIHTGTLCFTLTCMWSSSDLRIHPKICV